MPAVSPLSPAERAELDSLRRAQGPLPDPIFGRDDVPNMATDLAPRLSRPSSTGVETNPVPFEAALYSPPNPDLSDPTVRALQPQSTLTVPEFVARPYGAVSAAPFPSREPGFLQNLKSDVEGMAEGAMGLPRLAAGLGLEMGGALTGPVSGIPKPGATPLTEGMIRGTLEHYSQLIQHPIKSFEERPLSTALDVTGVLGSAGLTTRLLRRTGKAAGTTSLFSRIENLSDAKSVRTALREAGVPSKEARAYSVRIAEATTAADRQAVLAQMERAIGRPLTEAGATRGTRPLDRLAGFENLLKQQSVKMASLTDDLNRNLAKATGGKSPEFYVRDVEESLATYKDMQAALFESAQARMGKGTPQEAAQIQRTTAKLSEELRVATVEELKKASAVPLEDVSIEALDRALREHQGAVAAANSVYEAELGKWSHHTPDRLADMPLHNLVDDISPPEWLARKSWLTGFLREKGISNLFGAEERILDRTQAGEAFKVVSARMRRDQLRLEAPDHIRLGDVVHTTDRTTRRLMHDNYRKWIESGRPESMEMIVNGQATEMTVPGKFFELADVGDEIRRARLQLGRETVSMDINDLGPNYLPKKATAEMMMAFQNKSGKHYEALRDWATSKGKNPAEIDEIADIMFPKTQYAVRRSGSWENPRLVDLPERHTYKGKVYEFLKSDPFEVWSDYVTETSRRSSFATHFGKDGEKFLGLVQKETDGQVRKSMEYVFRALQGIPDATAIYSNPGFQALVSAESVARTAQLSMAWVPNATGMSWVARKWGMVPTARSQWKIWQATGNPRWNPIYADAAARDLRISQLDNAWAHESLGALGETESLVQDIGMAQKFQKASREVLRKTGPLEPIERNTNKVSGFAANYAVEDMLERLVRPTSNSPLAAAFGMDRATIIREIKRDFAFSSGDIERMAATGMTAADRAQVMQRAPGLVNAYNRGPLLTRQWMRHPLAQRALAYTSWRLTRGQMVWNAIDEFRLHGNVTPLLKELGYGAATGEVVKKMQDFIFNRGQEDEKWYADLANDLSESAAGGILGGIADGYNFSESQGVGSKIWDVIQLPLFSTLDQFSRAITEATKPGGEPLRALVKAAPAARALRTGALRLFDPMEAEREMRGDLFKRKLSRLKQEQKPILRRLTGF